MIIDGHAHTYPDQAAEKVLSTFMAFHRMEPTASIGTGTVQDLLERMERSHTDYTVTANFAPRKSVRKVNEWSLTQAKENPCLIPLVSVYPDLPLEEIQGYFVKGAKGIKMHNGIQNFEPMDPGLDPMYTFCAKNQIPVTIHCGETSRVHMNEYAEMSHILQAVEQHPDVLFVLTHLAAGDPETVLKIASKHENILFDTSITFSGEHCIHRIHDNAWENDRQAAQLFREIGCERVAFGSDYPFGNPGKAILRIQSLPLSGLEKQAILGDNTRKIYQL